MSGFRSCSGRLFHKLGPRQWQNSEHCITIACATECIIKLYMEQRLYLIYTYYTTLSYAWETHAMIAVYRNTNAVVYS